MPHISGRLEDQWLAIFTRKMHDIKGVRSLERLPIDESDENEEPKLNTTADRSHQYASRRPFGQT
jgi:hypothetical protein